jgi:hypothetical protein
MAHGNIFWGNTPLIPNEPGNVFGPTGDTRRVCPSKYFLGENPGWYPTNQEILFGPTGDTGFVCPSQYFLGEKPPSYLENQEMFFELTRDTSLVAFQMSKRPQNGAFFGPKLSKKK